MADPSRPVTGYPAPPGYPQHNPIPNGHATAYPYAAPPPPPPQPTYYNPNPNPYYSDPYAAQRTTFFRRIFAFLIASIIITGTIIFIVWLVLRPRIPVFRVDSFTLTNFNISPSTSLITGNWDVRFTVRNPNRKIALSYDHIEAYVFYKSESLSVTTVPPFAQGTKNETSVRATFAAASAYIENSVADGINSERSRGSVVFNVRMLARVRFKAGVWRARKRLLTVFCRDLSIALSSNSSGGSLTGGSRECRVGL